VGFVFVCGFTAVDPVLQARSNGFHVLGALVGILGSTSLKVAASTPPEDRPDHFATHNGLVRRLAFDHQSAREAMGRRRSD
jgi:hypothetical protein